MKKNFIFFLITCFIISSILPSFSIKADTLYFTDFYTVDSASSFSNPELASEIYSSPSSEITQAFMDSANTVQPSSQFLSKDFCLACLYDVTGYMDVYGINNVTNTYIIYVNSGAQYFVCEFDNEDPQSYMCHYKAKGTDWDGGWVEYNVFNNISSTYQDITVRGFNIGDGNRRLVSTCNVDYVLHYDQFYDYSGISYGTNPSDLAHLIYDLKNGLYDAENFSSESSSSNVETNQNHLYLSNCDAGFTKPLSLNNLNSSGGGYVYFTYNFDDWINSHSGDYTLQCNSTFYINNSSTGSIVRKNLDISGVAIYSLSELGDFVDWQNLNTTFMGYPNQILTGNYIKGYVYSLTYTQFGILQERYAKAGAHTVSYWVVKFANMLPGVKITENNVNYETYFNTVVPSRFDLKVSFKIIDNVSGEESGTYTKTFNMLTGISNVDSNSIQDNNNPYVPTSSDDLQLPSIDDNGNGYLVKTGDNNQIVNLTTPDNIKLFIDNGFQQFLTWYETSADTAYASNRFWSNMGIFEDNPATELYSEYFGFLPDDFKTLILSCAGIGIVGGAYCILRRRLH